MCVVQCEMEKCEIKIWKKSAIYDHRKNAKKVLKKKDFKSMQLVIMMIIWWEKKICKKNHENGKV